MPRETITIDGVQYQPIRVEEASTIEPATSHPANHRARWTRRDWARIIRVWHAFDPDMDRSVTAVGESTPWVQAIAPVLGRTPAAISLLIGNACAADALDERDGLVNYNDEFKKLVEHYKNHQALWA